MNEPPSCPSCGRELKGAIETTTVREGDYVHVVQKGTPDCNWDRCTGCKSTLCERCRRDRPEHCCPVGRAVDRERLRAKLRPAGAGKKPITKEVAKWPNTKSST